MSPENIARLGIALGFVAAILIAWLLRSFLREWESRRDQRMAEKFRQIEQRNACKWGAEFFASDK